MELGTGSGGLYILAAVLMGLGLEAWWLLYRRRQAYPWREVWASVGVAVGKRLVDAATAGVVGTVLLWVYEQRLMTWRLDSLWALLALFVLVEFVYYWHHRWAHEIRWLWATHSVHHTPAHMNLSVAGRLGWTGLLSGSFLFFTPLVWLGFHPLAVLLMLSLSLFYQIWLHTELVGRLGWLEWVLNTPSHHRAHHGSNRQYIDKNYGGVLIVFDRLFGTFVQEREPVVYGLTRPVDSHNPVVIALHEWRAMARDVRRARCWSVRWRLMFGRTGWRPQSGGE